MGPSAMDETLHNTMKAARSIVFTEREASSAGVPQSDGLQHGIWFTIASTLDHGCSSMQIGWSHLRSSVDSELT